MDMKYPVLDLSLLKLVFAADEFLIPGLSEMVFNVFVERHEKDNKGQHNNS